MNNKESTSKNKIQNKRKTEKQEQKKEKN